MTRKRIPESSLAWTWEIQDPNGVWVLCKWAEPWEACLKDREKPSDEARKVCVRMIRNSDYIKAGLRSRKVKKKEMK